MAVLGESLHSGIPQLVSWLNLLVEAGGLRANLALRPQAGQAAEIFLPVPLGPPPTVRAAIRSMRRLLLQQAMVMSGPVLEVPGVFRLQMAAMLTGVEPRAVEPN